MSTVCCRQMWQKVPKMQAINKVFMKIFTSQNSPILSGSCATSFIPSSSIFLEIAAMEDLAL